MAFFFCGFALLMFGPSIMLGIKPTLAWTLVGIGSLGISVAFLFVPLLPEIISSVSEKEGLENSPFLADKASGIYNAAYGVGNCLAPIIGGIIANAKDALYENDPQKKGLMGFRFTCDVMALSSFGFGFLYFIVVILPGLCRGNKSKSDHREQKLIADLGQNAVDNSLTIEFEQNQLNNSNRQTGTK
jgi:hypothetical protein